MAGGAVDAVELAAVGVGRLCVLDQAREPGMLLAFTKSRPVAGSKAAPPHSTPPSKPGEMSVLPDRDAA